MSQRLDVDLLTSVGQKYMQLVPCCMIMICVVDVIEPQSKGIVIVSGEANNLDICILTLNLLLSNILSGIWE